MKLPPTHRRLQKNVNKIKDTDLMKTPDGWEKVFPEMVGDDVSHYTCPLARLRSKPLTSNTNKKTVRLDSFGTYALKEAMERGYETESQALRTLIQCGHWWLEEHRAKQKQAPTPKPLSFWERRREAKFQRSLQGVRF